MSFLVAQGPKWLAMDKVIELKQQGNSYVKSNPRQVVHLERCFSPGGPWNSILKPSNWWKSHGYKPSC